MCLDDEQLDFGDDAYREAERGIFERKCYQLWDRISCTSFADNCQCGLRILMKLFRWV